MTTALLCHKASDFVPYADLGVGLLNLAFAMLLDQRVCSLDCFLFPSGFVFTFFLNFCVLQSLLCSHARVEHFQLGTYFASVALLCLCLVMGFARFCVAELRREKKKT